MPSDVRAAATSWHGLSAGPCAKQHGNALFSTLPRFWRISFCCETALAAVLQLPRAARQLVALLHIIAQKMSLRHSRKEATGEQTKETAVRSRSAVLAVFKITEQGSPLFGLPR